MTTKKGGCNEPRASGPTGLRTCITAYSPMYVACHAHVARKQYHARQGAQTCGGVMRKYGGSVSDQRQDHDAARACACARACVCGSMASHTSCRVHVVVSHTSCKRCCHACTLHVPCNHHVSGRHVTYVSRVGDAAMQFIMRVPILVCSGCRTREPDMASIIRK